MALVRLISNKLRCPSNQQSTRFGVRLFCTQNADVFATSSPANHSRTKKSGNDIRLIGRLKNEVISLPNGFDSFLLRTATKNLGKLLGVMHNIKVNRDLIERPSLSENDLVYINGEIVYERFTRDSENLSTPHIFAKKIHRLENNSDPMDLEQLHKGIVEFNENVKCLFVRQLFNSHCVNEVKLVGHIGGDIHDENATIFSFVTNTGLNSYGANDTFYADWHRVLILNGKLRDFVRTHLKRSDRLLIDGEIIYNKYEMKDGNFATITSILATRIQKLQWTKRGENETDTETTQTTAQQ